MYRVDQLARKQRPAAARHGQWGEKRCKKAMGNHSGGRGVGRCFSVLWGSKFGRLEARIDVGSQPLTVSRQGQDLLGEGVHGAQGLCHAARHDGGEAMHRIWYSRNTTIRPCPGRSSPWRLASTAPARQGNWGVRPSHGCVRLNRPIPPLLRPGARGRHGHHAHRRDQLILRPCRAGRVLSMSILKRLIRMDLRLRSLRAFFLRAPLRLAARALR